MKQTIRLALAAAALLGAGLAHAGDLTVKIDGIESDKGAVRVMLFDEASWPRMPVRDEGVPAVKGSATVVLKDVAPGDYVFVAYHDKNGNGMLDMDQGMPKEMVSVSNDPAINGGPPSFEAAKVTVTDQGLSATVKLEWIM